MPGDDRFLAFGDGLAAGWSRCGTRVLADGTIAAAAGAEHQHRQERTVTSARQSRKLRAVGAGDVAVAKAIQADELQSAVTALL